jgi:EmrB/QacA subfamily drug resistance transporter
MPQQATDSKTGRLALALLAFAHLIISLDYTIVFVALPDIEHALGFTAQTVQWAVSAYVVPYGGLLLLGGRCCDLLGRRRMFVFGLGLFALSSFAGALATTPGLLIAARAVQGLGGAFLFPATLSLINTTFSEGAARNHALSVWAGVGGSGMALGGLLGGVLTQGFGWQAVFFVNVPLALVAVVLGLRVLVADRPAKPGRRFDMPGAITGTLGTVLLVFALVQGPELGWTSATIVGALLGAGALLACFAFIERSSADPLMPLQLFADPDLRIGLLIIVLFSASFGSLLYFLTIHFQKVMGFSALKTGFAYLLPYGVIFVASSLSGRMATAFGARRVLTAGLSIGVLGMALLCLAMSEGRSYALLVPGLVGYSAGMGLTFTAMFAVASAGVPGHQQGVASGIASTAQQIGNAVGLAILVAIANRGTEGLGGEALQAAVSVGLRHAVLTAAGCALLMVFVARGLAASKSASDPRLAETRARPAENRWNS